MVFSGWFLTESKCLDPFVKQLFSKKAAVKTKGEKKKKKNTSSVRAEPERASVQVYSEEVNYNSDSFSPDKLMQEGSTRLQFIV